MGDFVELLGSGKDHGCRLTYRVQDEAGGIAQALGLAEHFCTGSRSAWSPRRQHLPRPARSDRCEKANTGRTGPGSVLKQVPDPEPLRRRRAARATRSSASRRSRRSRKSDFAVVGIYIYPPDVFERHQDAEAEPPRRTGNHRREQPLPAKPAARCITPS